MDEKGKISKANLVKGAIVLSSVGASLKNVKATTYNGGDKVGTDCGAQGKKLDGPEKVVWECAKKTEEKTKKNCIWECNVNTTASKPCGHHTNSGSAIIKAHEFEDHDNNMKMEHDYDKKKVKGSHEHHGVHMSFNEMDDCDGTEDPPHTNHCSHGSHCNCSIVR